MAATNLVLRFLVELAGIGALAWIGLQLPLEGAARWVAVIGLPALLVVIWALLVAPNTDNGLTQSMKDAIGTVLLLGVAVGVALAGQPQFGIGFALVVAANAALLFVFGPEARDAFTGAVR
jgi:hypothetical protein